MPTRTPSPIRFGIFEIDLSRRELRRRGTRIKLQNQPFEVLAALLEQPGAVVTREQLQARLWRDDTFVDFDRGLNKAINRIREALGDTAATPRFIETLPRRGYRFVASIEVSAGAAASHVVRSSILPPDGAAFFAPHFALSRDGSRLAFVAADSTGRKSLWVRDLSAAEAQPMRDTEDARLPFWSPDGRRIGFFAGRKLKTVDIAGGRVQMICDIRVGGGGGAWHADDVIVFAADATGPLYRVALSVGAPAPVTPAPPESSSQLHCWPVFLPGTDRFLFFANRSETSDMLSAGLYAGSLSSPEVHLISSEIKGNVAFASGRLVFAQDGALKTQSFDIHRLRLCGDTASIVQHEMAIWDRVWYHTGFSLSDGGLLVFQSRRDFAPELVWTDPTRKRSGQIIGEHWDPCISPDGRYVALSADELRNGKWFICVHDLARGVTSRLTDGGHEWHPSWTTDGGSVLFDSTEHQTSRTYRIAADGSSGPERILERGSVCAHSARDGSVVFMRVGNRSPQVVVQLREASETVVLGPGVEPQFSPDGGWVAFAESGGLGIGVRPFPGVSPRIQISSGPGAQPRWRRDGAALFYISPDGKLMTVDFDSRTGKAGPPYALLDTQIVDVSMRGFQYDVAPDGRFLVNSLPKAPPLTLVAGCLR